MYRKRISSALVIALVLLALTAAGVLAGGKMSGGKMSGGKMSGGSTTDSVCVVGYDCPGDPYYPGATIVDGQLFISEHHDGTTPSPWAPGVQGSLVGVKDELEMRGVSVDWIHQLVMEVELQFACVNHGGNITGSANKMVVDIAALDTVVFATKNGKVTTENTANRLDVLQQLADLGAADCPNANWWVAISDAKVLTGQAILTWVEPNEDNPQTLIVNFDCTLGGTHESFLSDPDSIQCSTTLPPK